MSNKICYLCFATAATTEYMHSFNCKHIARQKDFFLLFFLKILLHVYTKNSIQSESPNKIAFFQIEIGH